MKDLQRCCAFHRKLQLHLFAHVVSGASQATPLGADGAPPVLLEYFLLQQQSARSAQLLQERRSADLQTRFLLKELRLEDGYALVNILASDRLNRAVAADSDLRCVNSPNTHSRLL